MLLEEISIGTRIRNRQYMNELQRVTLHNVLDIGCGAGVLSKQIEPYAIKITKMDNHPRAAGVVKGNIMDMPFSEKQFDIVIAADILEHVDSPDIALKEICRVMTDEGRLYLTVPSDRWYRICRVLNITKETFGHKVLFDKGLI